MEPIFFLCVKDDEGTLRPQRGCWMDTYAGRVSAEVYLQKNKGDTVVKILVSEVDQYAKAINS